MCFFSSVLNAFQFNHNISMKKDITSFAALLLGCVSMLWTYISSVHVFLKKEAEMDTAMLQSTWCFGSCEGMSQLR